ncbi:hypothetical protein CPJCM30710_31810 [Clostridium polyendosporum]|uniref:DUF1659 domain-containing protein n=1 Tax=Clostridium polyendosporum TaxID=69208 RepID=A0A919S1G9_9CLOT|nr:DUF1659 domain-containing protein [Clostridium polyendosporum]GIM30515.1 hypothetical protein CPJCM30710_31810 [Clostridium polyendosporum]
MATTLLTGNSMVLKYKTGVNEKGDDIFKTQRFSNVRLDINDDDFYSVGEAIQTLLDASVIYVLKEQDYILEK